MKLRLLMLNGFVGMTMLPCFASTGTSGQSSASATIDAPVSVVWAAIKTERLSDPLNRHVVNQDNGDYLVTENFKHLPVVGKATCTYEEHEVPMKGLQYQMVSSDKMKVFEGKWELTPVDSGKRTLVKLSHRTDFGLAIPFSKKITEDTTQKSVNRKLVDIESIVSTTKVAALPAGS